MLWALVYGHRRGCVIVAATDRAAKTLLEAAKTELWENPLLLDDFPEICYPFYCLADEPRAAKSQTWNDEKTRVGWSGYEIVVASTPHSRRCHVAESFLVIRTITGAIRGYSRTLRDGTVRRPDAVFLDDIQTRKSARSRDLTREREDIVNADIAGLEGISQTPIVIVMACTVICNDDLSSHYLDRERYPEWHGERTKMVYEMPIRLDLWDHYWELLRDQEKLGGDGAAHTDFYREHRKEMDTGSQLAWPECYSTGFLSALEYAMRLRYASPAAFAAERQNEPLVETAGFGTMLTSAQITAKVNGLPRGVVPADAVSLAAFVDVQDDILFYAVTAWGSGFAGSVVDYGSFPPQSRRYFTLHDIRPTLREWFTRKDPAWHTAHTDALIAAGLDALLPQLTGAVWHRTDGATASISRCLVDTGWKADVVRAAIRRLKQPATATPVVMPSKGIGVTVTKDAFGNYKRKPGDVIGRHWLAKSPQQPGHLRLVEIDTNHWKTFLHERLKVQLGGPSCLSLYGDKGADHEMLGDHLTAEIPERIASKDRQREVVEWRMKPNPPDNHFLDCLVGCCVGGSLDGCKLAGVDEERRPAGNGQVIRLSELQRGRRG